MAMVTYRGEKKQSFMLRDYLRDDASSCSSNGFRSFPRRQCCAAARSIIEKEVTGNNNRHNHNHHHQRRHHTKKKRMVAKNECSFSYALQRASMAVVNAVKLLPFNSSPVKNNGDSKRFLPRSFSKKLFRRNFFWKKHKNNNKNQKSDHHHHRYRHRQCDEEDKFDDEIERWISSGVVGKEKYQPLDLSNDTMVTNNSPTSVSNSDDKSSDSSWSDISFSSDSSENDDVERTHKMKVSKIDAVIAAQTSAVNNEKNVRLEVERQHTGPISVFDFTNKDEGGFSSPFTTPRPSRSKGTKERLMKKLGRLEPVNLESLFLSPEIQHHTTQCSIQPCSTPSYILSSDSEDDDDEDDDNDEQGEEEGMSQENEVERQAQHLLNVTKSNVVTVGLRINPVFEFELENVLLDYFRQNVAQMESNALLKTAENWLSGHYDNLILGWEVKDKRQAYIRDMEEGGWWPNDTKLEREEIGAKLGDEVLAHLIQALLVDL